MCQQSFSTHLPNGNNIIFKWEINALLGYESGELLDQHVVLSMRIFSPFSPDAAPPVVLGFDSKEQRNHWQITDGPKTIGRLYDQQIGIKPKLSLRTRPGRHWEINNGVAVDYKQTEWMRDGSDKKWMNVRLQVLLGRTRWSGVECTAAKVKVRVVLEEDRDK